METIKVLSIFGTRPEAIKMAPLAIALGENPHISSQVCVTAQHREMLDSVLNCFGLTPDYDLDIMGKNQSLTDVTSRVLERLNPVFSEAAPDLVLVHGDTTTTFSSALASFYAKIPVGHVEAGLRTFDRYSPFPEEMNRSLVGRLATLHFAPTSRNAENLSRENVQGDIYITGNTVIDAMKYTVGSGTEFSSEELRSLDLNDRKILVLTCHRRENYGKPMENIFSAVRDIALEHPEVLIIYPVHMSPIVREAASSILDGVENIKLIEPLDAIDMHRLMAKSYFVMTDSGGIQEEAPALGKPVLVLRRETERPEAVSAGTVRLSGIDYKNIMEDASDLLTNADSYNKMAKAVNPYGDGNACARICDAILYWAGINDTPPSAFDPFGEAQFT